VIKHRARTFVVSGTLIYDGGEIHQLARLPSGRDLVDSARRQAGYPDALIVCRLARGCRKRIPEGLLLSSPIEPRGAAEEITSEAISEAFLVRAG